MNNEIGYNEIEYDNLDYDQKIYFHTKKIFELQKNKELENNKNSKEKYLLVPPEDLKAFQFFENQEKFIWSVSELKFHYDIDDYRNKLTENERQLINTIIAFFLVGDGMVMENISLRFNIDYNIDLPEIKLMLIAQNHIECVHALTYNNIALSFLKEDEIKVIKDLISSKQCVKNKTDYIEKWMCSYESKYKRLTAFACIEGIFFCSLFAIIFWFRSKSLLSNFITANQLIARDESLHRDFGIYLVKREIENIGGFTKEIKNEIIKIVHESIEVEDSFIDDLLKIDIGVMNKENMKDYSRSIADNMLFNIFEELHYHVKVPKEFSWIESACLEQKGNFYETTIAAYNKVSSEEALADKDDFDIDENEEF